MCVFLKSEVIEKYKYYTSIFTYLTLLIISITTDLEDFMRFLLKTSYLPTLQSLAAYLLKTTPFFDKFSCVHCSHIPPAE
jgi:hypothetical protein